MAQLLRFNFNEYPGHNATTAVDLIAGGSGSHSGTYTWGSTFNDGQLEPGGLGGRYVRIAHNDSGSITTLGNISDLRITGEMTLMFWYYGEWAGVDSWHPIMEVNGTDETQPENKLFAVSRESNGRLSMRWEHSAGTDVDVYSSNDIMENSYKWYHCAVVRELNGANYNVLFYINGTLADTQNNGGSGYTGPDGGGNSLAFIGRNEASTEPLSDFSIDSLRLYNSAENSTSISSVYSTEYAELEAFPYRDGTTTITYLPNKGTEYLNVPMGTRAARENSGFYLSG
jgi:hypothetical protein